MTLSFLVKRRSNITKTSQGFSLIELMGVLAVIAILTTIAFGAFRYLQRAKESGTQTKLAALHTMVEEYNARVGEYPTDLQELIEGPSKPQLQKRFGEAIAKQDDLEDAWKQPFVYTLNPKGSRPPFDVYSMGSKGDAQIRARGMEV